MGRNEKNLIERWRNDPAWRHRWERIALWIFGGSEVIDIIEDLEYTPDGYLDLRGFPINSFVDIQEYTNLQRANLIQDSRGLISKKRFEKIDFSYADFSGRYIEKCKFFDCIFGNVKMLDIQEAQCSFRDCIFRKGIYGGFLGMGESRYKNVRFQSVKMHRTAMWWPDFEDCLFQDCNLKYTDFGGAHFKNVKFIGKVEDVWFRGKMPERYKSNCKWMPDIEERWDRVLPMEADFSEATLSNLTISDFCDLSEVILPSDGNCYLIPNLDAMRNDIGKRLKKEKKRLLEELLEYYLTERENQNMKIFCLNDVYREIQKDFAPEEQQESYDLCKAICNDLLNKGILTLGKIKEISQINLVLVDKRVSTE